MRFLGPLSPLSRGRLIAMVVACGMLVSVLVCAWVLQRAWVEADRAAEREATNLASLVAQNIGRTVSQYDQSLQAVARGMALPGLWDLPPELRQSVLFDRAAGAVPFGFLNVLDASGAVIADMQARTPRPANFGHRDYFLALRREPQDQLFIGRPVLTAPGHQATVPMARRRTLADGVFAGVVVGSMRLAAIQDLFASANLGRGGTIALTRADGVILMRLPFNADDIGRTPDTARGTSADTSRGTSTDTSRGASTDTSRGASTDTSRGASTDTSRGPDGFMPHPNVSGGPVWTVDADGARRLTVQRRVGDLPLLVTVGLAEADIHAGWWPLAAGLGVVLAVVGATGLLAVLHTARLSRARARAEAAAERVRAEQVRTTTTVSHELRSPLTSLLCYAEMLGEADLPPVEAGRLAALRNAGEHLRTVIDRLIELTRSESELDRPRPFPTDLDELVEQSRRLVEPLANRRALVLTSSVAPELPRHVLLDASLVRMVLNNLLTNALKYTDRGHVELRVSGSSRRLRFEVKDTGPGIPSGKRSRLFKEFDRLDTTAATPGSGYGLSVAHRMVANMGGALGYADNPGGGSVFWFEVAISPAAASAPLSAPAAAPVREATFRLLLVEDDPTNSDVATTWLRKAGHQISHATNGLEGLHLATSEEFDLIITDMRMPEMNGLEMARRIRGLSGRRGRTPILLLSADMQVSRMPNYEPAQVTLLLPKPYGSAQLLGAVHAAIAAASPPTDRPAAPDAHGVGCAPAPHANGAAAEAVPGANLPPKLPGRANAPPKPPGANAPPEPSGANAPRKPPGANAPRKPPGAPATKAASQPEAPVLLEASMLDDLAAAIEPEDFISHLHTLCTRIETLMGYLTRHDERADQELCDLAHDTGSTAGLLGFTALSAALRRFQQASYEERRQSADLAGIARESLDLLRRRIEAIPANPG